MLKTVEYFKGMILKGGYERICNSVSTIKLRPNDQTTLLDEEGYNNYRKAVDEIINEYYKDDKINEYYISYNRTIDGWMSFDRWLLFN